jgi:hypothetical protein
MRLISALKNFIFGTCTSVAGLGAPVVEVGPAEASAFRGIPRVSSIDGHDPDSAAAANAPDCRNRLLVGMGIPPRRIYAK